VAGGDGSGKRPEVAGDGFGVDAAEPGVHLAADLEDLTAGALQDSPDLAAAGAKHWVDNQVLRVVGDGLNIDQSPQMVEVGQGGIEALDQAGLLGPIVIHQIWAAAPLLVVVEVDLDSATLLGQRRAGIGRLQLHAVITRGVVRGGDHNPANRPQLANSQGDGRRGDVGVGEEHSEAVGGQDARRLGGVAIREKPRVEAHHHLVRVGRLAECVAVEPLGGGDGVGNRLRHQAQIVKSEGVGDHGSPAVGAEVNRHGGLKRGGGRGPL